MATFVLVHGGWGGGWEWRGVADGLVTLGHTAFTPTLTGLGERSHLLSRSIGLETHVADVVQAITWERLQDVVLVGHSYGGMVITVAAPRISERIRGLVYIDAFIPEDGQRETDLLDPTWAEEMLTGPAQREGEGWLVPFPFAEDLLAFPPVVAERYRESPQPLATFTDPATVDERSSSIPSAFVRCTRKEPGEDAFVGSAATARQRGWLMREIHSGHDVQLEDPGGIASILDELSMEL